MGLLTKGECLGAAKALSLGVVNVKEVSSHDVPAGCSVRVSGAPDSTTSTAEVFFNAEDSSATCGQKSGPEQIMGTSSVMGLKLSVTVDKPKAQNAPNNVTITMSGPANVWFGIGFNAKVMATSPYTIV